MLAFFTICAGIVLLQLSRVDPKKLNMDGKTNLLLEANRQELDHQEEVDDEKAILVESEAPGASLSDLVCITSYSFLY